MIGRRFSAGYLRFQIGPVPEGRGEPSGLKMIRITSFAEKKQPSFAVFRAKHSLRRFTPALRDEGPLLFLSTGAEAPAYYQSASPRRRRFSRSQGKICGLRHSPSPTIVFD